MRRDRALLAAWGCTLAVALFLPGLSVAAPKKREVVLLLRLESNEFDPQLVDQYDALTRKLVVDTFRGARMLAPPLLDFDSMRIAAGCGEEVAACLAVIGGTLRATIVVRVGLAKNGDTARFQYHLVRVRGEKARTGTGEIPEFGPNSVEIFKNQLTTVLGERRIERREAPEARGGSIALVATDREMLEDIELYLDDEKHPLAALAELSPGEHSLEVHKEGFDPFRWAGEVKEGAETRVVVELRALGEGATAAVPGVERDPSDSKRADPMLLRPDAEARAPVEAPPGLFYTYLLAGGAVTFAAVGAGFAIYQIPIETRCRMDPIQCTPALRKRGDITELVTFTAYPLAAALGIAAAVAFYFEDGPSLFAGAVVPLEDGALAAVQGRF